MKSLITLIIGLIFLALCAACGPEPRIHADIVKDQLDYQYYTVNDSVVHNVNNGEYYVYKQRTHQYILIE